MYHEPPKDFASLPKIAPKELGKTVPLELAEFATDDPFVHLVPAHVHHEAAEHNAQVHTTSLELGVQVDGLFNSACSSVAAVMANRGGV